MLKSTAHSEYDRERASFRSLQINDGKVLTLCEFPHCNLAEFHFTSAYVLRKTYVTKTCVDLIASESHTKTFLVSSRVCRER